MSNYQIVLQRRFDLNESKRLISEHGVTRLFGVPTTFQLMLDACDVEELKSKFLNLEFDTKDFVLDAGKLAAVAGASGETREKYLDTGHPDFQAAPGTRTARI